MPLTILSIFDWTRDGSRLTFQSSALALGPVSSLMRGAKMRRPGTPAAPTPRPPCRPCVGIRKQITLPGNRFTSTP